MGYLNGERRGTQRGCRTECAGRACFSSFGRGITPLEAGPYFVAGRGAWWHWKTARAARLRGWVHELHGGLCTSPLTSAVLCSLSSFIAARRPHDVLRQSIPCGKELSGHRLYHLAEVVYRDYKRQFIGLNEESYRKVEHSNEATTPLPTVFAHNEGDDAAATRSEAQAGGIIAVVVVEGQQA